MPLRQLIVAAGALICATLAGRDAAVAHYLTSNARAPHWLEQEPAIILRAGNWSLFDHTGGQAARQAEAAAVSALRASPLRASALRQLGLARRAETKDWLPAVELAERVSLRDTGTQLIFLELAARSGDFQQALRRVDDLLTLVPEAGAQIYPAMAALTEQPDFRRALPRYAARAWYWPFLAVAAGTGEPQTAAELVEAGPRPPRDRSGSLTPLLQRLVDAGQFNSARQVAVAIGASPANLRDFTLTPATSDAAFTPLTWRLFSEGFARWSFDEDGYAEAEIETGQSPIIAERTTMVPPGQYALVHTIRAEGTEGGERLQWKMWCKGANNDPAWILVVPVGSEARAVRSLFSIPNACVVQRWELSVAGSSEATAPLRLRIEKLALEGTKA